MGYDPQTNSYHRSLAEGKKEMTKKEEEKRIDHVQPDCNYMIEIKPVEDGKTSFFFENTSDPGYPIRFVISDIGDYSTKFERKNGTEFITIVINKFTEKEKIIMVVDGELYFTDSTEKSQIKEPSVFSQLKQINKRIGNKRFIEIMSYVLGCKIGNND